MSLIGVILSSILLTRFSGSEYIKFPVQCNDRETGDIKSLIFEYQITDNKNPLENAVLAFCEEHSVFKNFCHLLMQRALLELMKSRNDYRDHLHYMLRAELRNDESFASEVLNAFQTMTAKLVDINEAGDNETERSFDELIYTYFESQPSKTTIADRICFIHSCTLASGNYDILDEILTAVVTSKLMEELRMIIVINYGPSVSALALKYPNVFFLQRSSEISKFEIPTLRHIQHFAVRAWKRQNEIKTENKPIQVLYLHTKGVSYKYTYQPVIDWRRMMLYFMVEKHQSLYYLLLSGAFDIAGCDYVTKPRNFEGNMWWATLQYLAKLPEIAWGSYKNAGETWLLSIRGVRIYIPHTALVDHYLEEYPRHKYVEEDVVPSERNSTNSTCIGSDPFEDMYGDSSPSVRILGLLLL